MMTTQRPLRTIGLQGRTPSAAAEEAVLMERLAAFLPDLTVQIEATLRETVNAGSRITDDVLAAEIEHTSAELVRHWFGCVLHAWQLWGQAKGELLLVDEGPLLPDRKDCPERLRAAWDEFYESSKESLNASIALDEDGRRFAHEGFVTNLRRVVAHGAVELPRSIVLASRADRVHVVPRN
jgi:hypothetical protein